MKILKSEILRAWEKEKSNIKSGKFIHTIENKDSQSKISSKTLNICPVAAVLKYRVSGSLYTDLLMFCMDHVKYGLYEHTVKHNIKDPDKIRNYAMNKLINSSDYLSLISCEHEYLVNIKNMSEELAYNELMKFVETYVPKQFDAVNWYEKEWEQFRNRHSKKVQTKKIEQTPRVIPLVSGVE